MLTYQGEEDKAEASTGIQPILQCLHDGTMHFDSKVRAAHHQLGRVYGCVELLITHVAIIMVIIMLNLGRSQMSPEPVHL